MLYQCVSKYSKMKLLTGFIFALLFSCQAQQSSDEIITGAKQLNSYLPMLKGKNIAVVANQTSLVDGIHLVDTLLARSVTVTKVFAPEH